MGLSGDVSSVSYYIGFLVNYRGMSIKSSRLLSDLSSSFFYATKLLLLCDCLPPDAASSCEPSACLMPSLIPIAPATLPSSVAELVPATLGVDMT